MAPEAHGQRLYLWNPHHRLACGTGTLARHDDRKDSKMRRFVFEDTEHDVKLTLDIPEEMFTVMKKSGLKKFDALKKLVIYTFEKGIDDDNRSWHHHKVDSPR